MVCVCFYKGSVQKEKEIGAWAIVSSFSSFHRRVCSAASCNWHICPCCSILFRPRPCSNHSRLCNCLPCISRMIWHNRCSCIQDFFHILPEPSIGCSGLHGRRIYWRIHCTKPGSFSTSTQGWLGTHQSRPKWRST